jgi:thiosulfate reductase cytochrome b subunit
MRHAVFSHLTIAPVFEQRLAPGITWGGWLVPLWLSIGIVVIMGLGMMAVAIGRVPQDRVRRQER